ncbi:MAG TPA: c-type cytochrome domain-containing protein [Puia sp.]|jgi:uncharacterized membrane protein|nr:c-type cytochrome domain-containing protein [Puia sp.]
MGVVFTFFGRLHPVLVHLPIGIILLALFLEVLTVRPGYAAMKPAADLALGLGVIFAAISCCTGYLLSLSGDYDSALVTVHQWLAISLTVLSGLLYLLLRGRPLDRVSGALAAITLVLLFLTGHWGGSLTHGPGYLTANLTVESNIPALRPVAHVQDAIAYTSLVQPVLHDNCYGCHSGRRIKGGLRLDGPDFMMKGGKDGPVIVSGHAATSLLIRRILLPPENDHHMAPKEKAQLTAAEIKLLQWWIETGASFDKPVGRLPQDNAMHAVLAAFQDGTAGPVADTGTVVLNIADSTIPTTPVAAAPADAVRRLQNAGALLLPVSQGSNYLSVSFPSNSIGPVAIQTLPLLKDQLLLLKCSFAPVGDEVIAAAAACPRLVRLWLDHTRITGKNLGGLRTLSNLCYLNLSSTAVSNDELLELRSLPKLKQLYLYQTRVDKSQWASLQTAFPHTLLDSGGYALPFLATDTAIVRAPVKAGK